MTLDDMQTLWQQHDLKLDRQLRTQALAAHTVLFKRTRATLGKVVLNLRLETAINAVAVIFLGGYAVDHVRQLGLWAAAVGLDSVALAILIGGIVPLVMLARLDYDRPALEIARSIDRIRLIRARVTVWTLFAAPLMWPPSLIVAMSAFFGIDAWTAFGPAWMVANFGFGAAVLAVAIVFARRYDSRRGPAAAIQPLVAALSGRSLRVATAQIAALKRYESGAE